MGWAVKADTHDFVGREAMLRRGVPRTRIGLQMTGKGIAREKQDVYLGEERIGHVTSGTHLPFLGGAYAMALVKTGRVQEGDSVEVDVRGRRVAARVVPLPFYKRAK